MAKRRPKWQTIAAILALLLLAAFGAYYYFFVEYAYIYVEVPLEKPDIRECIDSMRDRTYDYTSADQCGALWPGEREKCLAWVSGNPASCTSVIDDTDRAWCFAMASRNPQVCDAVGFGAEYCRAFITRDAARCAQIADTALRSRCELTIGDDTSGAFTEAEHVCGTERI